MNKTGKVILFILLVSVLLVSCGGQPPASPTPDMNALLTQSIGTLSASFFMTQTAIAPTITNTPLPTPTSLPTNTPLALPSALPSATQGFFATAIVYPSVTGTVYTLTPNPSSLSYGCNNLGFIRDVTVSSGTEMSPGESFTKTWQVANTGTCDWLSGYRLVPVSGEELAEELGQGTQCAGSSKRMETNFSKHGRPQNEGNLHPVLANERWSRSYFRNTARRDHCCKTECLSINRFQI